VKASDVVALRLPHYSSLWIADLVRFLKTNGLGAYLPVVKKKDRQIRWSRKWLVQVSVKNLTQSVADLRNFGA
jgi:hypothetical protein